MCPWTCPNPRCVYDKELKPEELCPLCAAAPWNLSFSEFGRVLKEKEGGSKSVERDKRFRSRLKRIKFCPRCGSPNINFLIYYTPSVWKCLNCDYEGVFILEGEQLAQRIREAYDQRREAEEHDDHSI
jgi:DNA-directed RNA polymerase subunit M